MKKQSRRKFAPEFKAKVALEALKNQFTLAELGAKHQLSLVVISKWKSKLLKNMSSVFDKSSKRQEDNSADMEQLYSQIGKLKVENDFLKKSCEKLGI